MMSNSDTMDCSPPGFSVHEISQRRILEWVAISSSRGSSWPRSQTGISCIARQMLHHLATWEAPCVCANTQSFSPVGLFEALQTTACQAPLNSGMGCHFLLQGTFPTQGSNTASYVYCTAGKFYTTAPSGKPSVILFGHSVISDSLPAHRLQQARHPCPSLYPRVCSNLCPLSRWCHPTISSSVAPFSLPSVFPSIRVFSNESALHISWPKYWSFSFSISPSNEY